MEASAWAGRIGRATGVAGGGVACALWLHMLVRVGRSTTPGVQIVMLLLSAGAVVASVARWPVALGLIGGVSFFPIGLYLLLTPSIYAGIGMANLLVVAAALLLAWARRGPERPDPEPTVGGPHAPPVDDR